MIDEGNEVLRMIKENDNKLIIIHANSMHWKLPFHTQGLRGMDSGTLMPFMIFTIIGN